MNEMPLSPTTLAIMAMAQNPDLAVLRLIIHSTGDCLHVDMPDFGINNCTAIPDGSPTSYRCQLCWDIRTGHLGTDLTAGTYQVSMGEMNGVQLTDVDFRDEREPLDDDELTAIRSAFAKAFGPVRRELVEQLGLWNATLEEHTPRHLCEPMMRYLELRIQTSGDNVSHLVRELKDGTLWTIVGLSSEKGEHCKSQARLRGSDEQPHLLDILRDPSLLFRELDRSMSDRSRHTWDIPRIDFESRIPGFGDLLERNCMPQIFEFSGTFGSAFANAMAEVYQQWVNQQMPGMLAEMLRDRREQIQTAESDLKAHMTPPAPEPEVEEPEIQPPTDGPPYDCTEPPENDPEPLDPSFDESSGHNPEDEEQIEPPTPVSEDELPEEPVVEPEPEEPVAEPPVPANDEADAEEPEPEMEEEEEE